MENLIGWAGPKDPPNLTPQSPQSPLRPPVLTQQASRPQQSGPGPLSRPRPGPASRKTPSNVNVGPLDPISRVVADLHPIAPKPGPMRIVAPIAPRPAQR